MDTLIITIAIQMHGKIINLTLNQETYNIFKNVQLYCASKGLIDYSTTISDEYLLVERLQNTFKRDLDKTSYKLLNQNNTCKDNELCFIRNITYDKTLSTTIGDPTFFSKISPSTLIQGIYLISIHNDFYKLLYPLPQHKQILNLIKISDLNILADFLHSSVPTYIIKESTPFIQQSTYINEENQILTNTTLSDKEKKEMIKQIREQFYNLVNKWKLTIENNIITSIKLSVFVEIINKIVNKKCFINLLDYSCNSVSIYIPENLQTNKQYIKNYDIEQGLNVWGGKIRKTQTYKNKKYNKENKKYKKSKKYNRYKNKKTKIRTRKH